MNKLLITGLVAGGLAVSMYASGAAAQGDAPGAGDKPLVRCIDVSRIQNSKVVDNKTIILYMRGGPDYKMNLAQRCPGLMMNKTWKHDAGGLSKLCEVDVIQVPILTSGSDMLSNSNYRPCIIDSIVPYDEKAEKAKAAKKGAAQD